jgi:hypothetical protein
MPMSLVNGPDHWRARAKEMRELATLAEGEAKGKLIELADAYEKLALRAVSRAASHS